MKVYTLRPEGFKREGRKAIIRGVIFYSLMLAFMAGFLWYLSGDQSPFAFKDVPVWPLCVFIAALILYTAVRAIRRALRILRDGWDSYELGLGEDFVLKKQVNMPEVEIGRDEVIRIQEARTNEAPDSLVIRSADSRRFIIVPTALDGYAEVKDQLGHWRQIEPLSTRKYVALQILLWMLVPAGYLVILMSQNLWLVLIVGILMMALVGWGMIELRRAMNVDSRVKNLRLVVFAIMVLTVITTVRVCVLVANLKRR